MAQAGRLREAEPHLAEQLIDLRGDGPDICEALVQGYFTNLQIAKAMTLLDMWQKDFPDDSQPYFMRGFLLQSLDKKREAAEAYGQGLALAPGNTLERYRLAQMLADAGQLDEAESTFHHCVKQDPKNPDYLAGWAYCLSMRGETLRAQQAFEEVVAKAPNHFDGLRQLGGIEFSQKRLDAALGHLKAAVRQRPYDRPTRYKLAQTLRALGRTEEAKPHLDYVAKAEKALSQVARYERTITERPNDPQLRCEMGKTLLEFGDPELGAKWLRTVLELQPDHADAHRALADYYQARGEWQTALYHRQRGGVK